ncbi:MAG: polyribonucleotide nucleotidyltransferase, partial [Planctomycetota bacterium]
NDPDVLAMVGSSAALSSSDLPFLGPTGSVRVGLKDGQFIINPTHSERDSGEMDLVVAGTREAVTMVECGAKEIEESVILDAIDFGYRVVREIVEMIDELVSKAGKATLEVEIPEIDGELKKRVHSLAYNRIYDVVRTPGKMERRDAIKAVCVDVIAEIVPEETTTIAVDPMAPTAKDVKAVLEDVKREVERHLIVKEQVRTDGRAFADIRDIQIEASVLPYAHGSVLFTRGETQALAVVTLGTSFDEQRVEGLVDEYKEKFMLHYNFPSFCVGESWPNRGPKRREIGHGNLAERALKPLLPDHDDFPYTVRIVSEIMESNGSSSMATVCGGTLALMDAGVQIQQPVAGIAMGLVKEGDQVCILSDILGSEDHNGDMDFKVAGTARGITALQMDIKIQGIDRSIMERALSQAQEGRLHILREMMKTLDKPRPEISEHAPKISRIYINPEKIGLVIGPSGKMIRGIQEETGATIEIEDDGKVTIWGPNVKSANAAKEKIELLTEEVKEGQTYEGRVVSVKDFGCFVEVLPGQEGLLHISELGDGFVENVSDVVSHGDSITVKVIGIDPQGRIRLSRKALLEGGGGGGRPSGEGRPSGGPPRGGRDRGPRNRDSERSRGPRRR